MIKKLVGDKKGFTIIELIVVIAIIAVLAAIVLVNVTQYINKGKNSAIQGNMTSLLTNAAVYFDANPGKYGSDFIGDTSIGCGLNSPIKLAVLAVQGNIACAGSATTQDWCGTSKTLAVGATAASTFCVDSTGYKGVLGSGKCTGTTYTCK